MITYEPFWNTLKNSDESTYTLIYNHNLSSSTIDRLRKNKPLSTTTLNDLCRILDCDINDIISYKRSENDQFLYKSATVIRRQAGGSAAVPTVIRPGPSKLKLARRNPVLQPGLSGGKAKKALK